MGFYHKTTAGQRALIVQRYAAGEPRKTIARDYKITEQSVGLYARRAGVPMRRPRKRTTRLTLQATNTKGDMRGINWMDLHARYSATRPQG